MLKIDIDCLSLENAFDFVRIDHSMIMEASARGHLNILKLLFQCMMKDNSQNYSIWHPPLTIDQLTILKREIEWSKHVRSSSCTEVKTMYMITKIFDY